MHFCRGGKVIWSSVSHINVKQMHIEQHLQLKIIFLATSELSPFHFCKSLLLAILLVIFCDPYSIVLLSLCISSFYNFYNFSRPSYSASYFSNYASMLMPSSIIVTKRTDIRNFMHNSRNLCNTEAPKTQ